MNSTLSHPLLDCLDIIYLVFIAFGTSCYLFFHLTYLEQLASEMQPYLSF